MSRTATFTPEQDAELLRLNAAGVSIRMLARLAVHVTTVLRREDGAWKVVDRHAEPITAPRPPEPVIAR